MEKLGPTDEKPLSVEYSVVIPVYNAADNLLELYERLTAVFQGISPKYEFLLVDDASTDDSWKIMQQLRGRDARVKIIQHARNFGQHRATHCGLRHSQGEYVITMDDDLQHPPEEIPKFVEVIRYRNEIDAVIGTYMSKHHSAWRNLCSLILNLADSHAFGKDIHLKLTSFRILRRATVREIAQLNIRNPRIGHLLLSVTDRIINITVAHHPRKHGRSGYSVHRLVSDALDNILSYSSLPLRIVSYVGFGSSILSFALGIYILIKYLAGAIAVQGWTTTILLLLFFFGVLLLCFGIVGEYLMRILRQVSEPPDSIIRKKEL